MFNLTVTIFILADCFCSVQGSYQCPEELFTAVVAFIEALWRGERRTAIELMRNDVTFWHDLCLPLTRDLKTPLEAERVCLQQEVVACANVMKIIAIECYSVEVLKQ